MIEVPTDRRGRACRIRLVPDGNEWNLNPNNVEGDLTAKKAARITLMDNSKWGEERVLLLEFEEENRFVHARITSDF